ncbi:hypothetical protein ACIG56_25425 [Nocardia fusca]|uniref:hypothetical protein n=1 Tax=Nocardia fusca TaxID=941183 RepID=UPI0037C8641E
MSGTLWRRPRTGVEFDDLSGAKPTGERNGSVHAAPGQEYSAAAAGAGAVSAGPTRRNSVRWPGGGTSARLLAYCHDRRATKSLVPAVPMSRRSADRGRTGSSITVCIVLAADRAGCGCARVPERLSDDQCAGDEILRLP